MTEDVKEVKKNIDLSDAEAVAKELIAAMVPEMIAGVMRTINSANEAFGSWDKVAQERLKEYAKT